MLAGRGHGRVDERRDDHVDVGPAAPAPVLGVVVGALHVVDRRAEADRAAEVLAGAGQAREVRQSIHGHVDLAGRAAELEPADLLLEGGLQRTGLDEPEVPVLPLVEHLDPLGHGVDPARQPGADRLIGDDHRGDDRSDDQATDGERPGRPSRPAPDVDGSGGAGHRLADVG